MENIKTKQFHRSVSETAKNAEDIIVPRGHRNASKKLPEIIYYPANQDTATEGQIDRAFDILFDEVTKDRETVINRSS